MKKEELNKKIGKRIVESREKKGWSQSDLARACNKDRQAIDRIEKGKTNSTVYSLYQLTSALGVGFTDLFKV